MELNSGLEEREEETHILTGQVKREYFLEILRALERRPKFFSQFQVEKATEELEEAERLEVEARREAVALQEQIEKMIQVIGIGYGQTSSQKLGRHALHRVRSV